MDDLTESNALRPGKYTALDRLPDRGIPKARYY
jgi:hypothetical protein